MKILFTVFFYLLCAYNTTYAQGSFYQKHIGSINAESSRSIVLGADSCLYCVGFTNDNTSSITNKMVCKFSYNGTLQWIKQLADTNYSAALYVNTTADGNLIICGETEPNQNNKNGFVLKMDTAGTIIWNTTINLLNNQYLKYCEETAQGAIIACGATNDTLGLYNMWVVKLHANGTLNWTKNYGSDGNETANQIKTTANGNYILSADVKNTISNNTYDLALVLLDTAGNIMWENNYGNSLENGNQGLVVLSNGNYLMYGETEIAPASKFDFWVDLIDAQGNTLWHKTIGSIGTDAAFSCVAVSNGYVFTGYSNSYNNLQPLDLIVLKTDLQGNTLWQNTYGSSGIDIGYQIINGYYNDFFITGNYGANNNDVYLLHLDNNGYTAQKSTLNKAYKNIYPNPTTCNITVDYNYTKAEIYNNVGTLITTLNYNNTHTINLGNVTNLMVGTYVVKIYDEYGIVSNYLVYLNN
jgi:hypothetical protein